MTMEIERIVSGDLNKNIEQCVSILMDVERRVHALKSELVTTLGAVPGQRTGSPLTGFPTTTTPVMATPGFSGVQAVPYYTAPITTPVATSAPAPWFHQGWNPTGIHGTPFGYGNVQGYPLSFYNPYYNTMTPLPIHPGFQGFNTLVQGVSPLGTNLGPLTPTLAPLSPVQNFGYLW
jgi:hypothetical protein